MLAAKASRLIHLFLDWDKNQDGVVTRLEFRKAFATLGYAVPREELDKLFDSVFDKDGSGTIDFREFNLALKGAAKTGGGAGEGAEAGGGGGSGGGGRGGQPAGGAVGGGPEAAVRRGGGGGVITASPRKLGASPRKGAGGGAGPSAGAGDEAKAAAGASAAAPAVSSAAIESGATKPHGAVRGGGARTLCGSASFSDDTLRFSAGPSQRAGLRAAGCRRPRGGRARVGGSEA